MTLKDFILTGSAGFMFVSLACAGEASATVILRPANIVLESGNPGQTLSAGYTTLETAMVRCADVAGCVLGLNIMSTVGQATCANEWAIVGLVDGNSVDGGPLVDPLPGPGKTQTRNWQGVYAIAFGNHTIVFQNYVPCPATAYQWSVRYLMTMR